MNFDIILKKPFNKPFPRFVATASLLYILWYALYELWLHPKRSIELLVVDNLVLLSSGMLKLFGYQLITGPVLKDNVRTIGIDGTYGLFIADSCAGVTLFALFAGFIIAYPGPVKWKLIFIPLGLITIHLINALRITGLCIITFHAPEYLDFNHHYTFTIIVYSYVFLLWVIWVNKFSKKQ
ncbi:exosortase family protein XrtF [bacterium AH-315-M05]|nr:exosortase family protein XrtF [bacterium AH-315-M05]